MAPCLVRESHDVSPMTNQEYLAAVASALGPLVAEVVFTGGLVVQEYWTIPALREPRATVDADVIVEAATYTEYAAFGNRLRERGFLQLAEDATPPYRWIKDDLILDVIPLAFMRSERSVRRFILSRSARPDVSCFSRASATAFSIFDIESAPRRCCRSRFAAM